VPDGAVEGVEAAVHAAARAAGHPEPAFYRATPSAAARRLR
jgi:hypothetical protein